MSQTGCDRFTQQPDHLQQVPVQVSRATAGWMWTLSHKRGVWTFAQNQFCWLIFSLWLSVCVYWCWCQIRRVVCRQRHVGLWTEDMAAVWKEQVDTENWTLETNGRTDMCSSSSRQNRTFVSHTMWHCGSDPKRECWVQTRLLWENQKCELTGAGSTWRTERTVLDTTETSWGLDLWTSLKSCSLCVTIQLEL